MELYTSTTFKNGSDKEKSLKQDKLIKFTPPELDENMTSTQK